MHPIKTSGTIRCCCTLHQDWGGEISLAGLRSLSDVASGFGTEKHDDAVGALVYVILGVVGDGIEEQRVHYV